AIAAGATARVRRVAHALRRARCTTGATLHIDRASHRHHVAVVLHVTARASARTLRRNAHARTRAEGGRVHNLAARTTRATNDDDLTYLTRVTRQAHTATRPLAAIGGSAQGARAKVAIKSCGT